MSARSCSGESSSCLIFLTRAVRSNCRERLVPRLVGVTGCLVGVTTSGQAEGSAQKRDRQESGKLRKHQRRSGNAIDNHALRCFSVRPHARALPVPDTLVCAGTAKERRRARPPRKEYTFVKLLAICSFCDRCNTVVSPHLLSLGVLLSIAAFICNRSTSSEAHAHAYLPKRCCVLEWCRAERQGRTGDW